MKNLIGVALMALATMQSAHAGLFGKNAPTEEELARARKAEENCIVENSFAFCTMQATRSRFFGLKDTELTQEQWRQINQKRSSDAAMSDWSGIAAGISQITSRSTNPIPMKGLGVTNLLGSLLLGSGTQSVDDFDKIVAFVSEEQAKTAEDAEKIIEEAYVSAYVKAIPGITSAEYEKTQINEDTYVLTYRLRGGNCDNSKCFLMGPWENICRKETCPRPVNKLILVEHPFLGKGRFWTYERFGGKIVFSMDPSNSMDIWKAESRPFPEFFNASDKLVLMQRVSENLPPWASYYLGPSRRRQIQSPVLLNSGKVNFFIKPNKIEAKAEDNTQN